MFWADKIARHIIDAKGYQPYRVDDMFTPSGYAHIGSLRGPLIHDMVYRTILDAGETATFTYVLNDFDTIDGLPPELFDRFEKYLGFPLRMVPSPEPGFANFADYFGKDFINVLTNLGVSAKILSSWDMYHEGKFNTVIREALDSSEKIQEIYQRVSGSQKKTKEWLPLQVICEKCGKLGTTRVYEWDGGMVSYACEQEMVTWAKGCGYKGEISPFDGNGKLPWKVDWPAHWKVLGITIEGAGKDHSSAGGSRDISRELCRDVFHIAEPYNLPYEFFLIGGKKMSSSKGLGLKARDLTALLPSAIGRFLFTRTDFRQAIEIEPTETLAIPDLFDEYDRSRQAYISGADQDLARAFVLAQTGLVPEKKPVFLPRFRDVANYIQLPNVDLIQKFIEIKGSNLTQEELKILKEREEYARLWIGQYAPKQYRMQMSKDLPKETETLSVLQKTYLNKVLPLLGQNMHPEDLQRNLFELAKEIHIDPKEAFSGVYTAFLGKPYGPRAAWFLLQYPQEDVIKRLEAVLQKPSVLIGRSDNVSTIQKPKYFSIAESVKNRYPTVTIGIALIKGIHVSHSDPKLQKETQELFRSLAGLTTETLGEYKEILCYRKLYKEMGIDWHSRRPSPEALLRRVALGKELYTVNTCVDAYNLVVMTHRVSVGAFDADNVKFPTVLRFAGEGDEISLLGDSKPTIYSAKELAYYDQDGGYNIDFNFRDAQRTMVTEKTTDVWVNVDGIADITQAEVGQTLHESVSKIMQYCGGTVEFSGVVR